QRRLAVVDVRHDGDVAKVLPGWHGAVRGSALERRRSRLSRTTFSVPALPPQTRTEDGVNASCSAADAVLRSSPPSERRGHMPKVSKESTSPIDQGGAGMDWRADLDGYTTEFVEVHVDADLTELLKGLPGDVCPSPHWGYVFKGRT